MAARGEEERREGDPVQRVAEIFREHGDFIRTVIRYQVHNRSEEEDLFQELFLEMIHRPVPGDIGNIRSYLYRAIVHHILDSARARKTYQRAMKKYAQKTRISINIRPARNAFLSENDPDDRHAVLAHLVRHLERRQAEALLLRYRDNCSIGEIAASMGVSDRTVSQYLSDGLRKLRTTSQSG